jgi:FAD/FMN-containing dehydrogenase/Fe-S oxidoreductase
MSDLQELRRKTLERLLRQQIAGEVRFDAHSRTLYSTDASIYQIEPIGVVIPRTMADVEATVQTAMDWEVPILPRGGGTSLSGQSIGPAIVIDFSKYLHEIIEIDVGHCRARVQPGVVLDQLNAALAPHGLQFGPDVATSSRANLGGMIGNNSAGARSIVYGKTVDHVVELSVLLSNGRPARFGPLSLDEWQAMRNAAGLEGTIYRTVDQVVNDCQAEIERRFPKILRRVSGYNLDEFLACAGRAGAADRRTHAGMRTIPVSQLSRNGSRTQPLNLAKLIVGSEGTLAVVTEALLNLVPLPKHRGLVMVHYDRLESALESLEDILPGGPSAVEIIDRMMLDLAASNLEAARQLAPVRGQPDALLLVEFSSDDAAEVAERAGELESRLARRRDVGPRVPGLDAESRDGLWRVRNAGMGLLYGIPGQRKPVSFVEDAAVSPEKLPEFARRFKAILAAHGTIGSFYGHASVGCLHVRPLLNLKDPAEVAAMRAIAEEVADLVLEFGGAMSGEHGDGLARSMWNEKLFGPVVYQAFRQVKAAFDPKGLLNPGKIVDAPDMREQLRAADSLAAQAPETILDFSRQGGLIPAIELCNGAGACRKMRPGTMCPSYMVTREEEHSTRGRANALRAALDGRLPGGLSDRRLYEVLDLCLMCKGCKAECPSNVDLAALKAEFLHQYYQRHTRPLGNFFLGHIRTWNRLGAIAPRWTNSLLASPAFRWLLERVAGIDHRRRLPLLAPETLEGWWRRHSPHPRAGQRGRVVLLDDCFTAFHEPRVAIAAIELLERSGYAVELAGIGCCGRTLLSKGYLREAQQLARRNLAQLAPRVGPDVPLLGCEPSCLLTFADEYRMLRLGPAAERVATAAQLVDVWFADVAARREPALRWRRRGETVLLHTHCHQKALVGTQGTLRALKLIPELNVRPLDAGCCGMAGSFGYEREHYDLSVAIAERGVLAACRERPNVPVLATGFSCRCQLDDLDCRRAAHPIEWLAEQCDV